MAKRMSDVQSGTSSLSSFSNKDQEIHYLQKFLKEKDKVIRQMSDDSKSLQRALETIKSKMKESGNIVELRRELKEERRLNEELRDTVQRLQKELQDLQDVSVRRSHQEDSDIEDMVQQALHISVRLDKQLMEVIKNDEVVNGIATEDQRTNIRKDNELVRRLEDDLEIEPDITRHQIAEYEDRILQLKADLTEETKKVVKLDKELISERNAVEFLKTQIEEHRRMAELKQIRESKLIEFLQTKLKASLENEEKLRNDLASMNMEVENASRNLPNFAATVQNESDRTSENLEESREHNAELREDMENEMSIKYEKLEIPMEERERLINSLALTNGLKKILEVDLGRTTEELTLASNHSPARERKGDNVSQNNNQVHYFYETYKTKAIERKQVQTIGAQPAPRVIIIPLSTSTSVTPKVPILPRPVNVQMVGAGQSAVSRATSTSKIDKKRHAANEQQPESSREKKKYENHKKRLYKIQSIQKVRPPSKISTRVKAKKALELIKKQMQEPSSDSELSEDERSIEQRQPIQPIKSPNSSKKQILTKSGACIIYNVPAKSGR
ncbi:filamin-A-interacting protein 1-like isoform X1 [Temnothorax curvispinosus]|uniref:Filamin-A-interacting protein 1-like isoform X1 n=1 Tax=Temnothorax curvispinosus TaxID=300111 RepID=A0A6J1PXU2_9HYME|nr:filamin-A-interacting protein 1-like isoform X1 [Temnothorax curvispinosus]